jgi:hypothetical protein
MLTPSVVSFLYQTKIIRFSFALPVRTVGLWNPSRNHSHQRTRPIGPYQLCANPPSAHTARRSSSVIIDFVGGRTPYYSRSHQTRYFDWTRSALSRFPGKFVAVGYCGTISGAAFRELQAGQDGSVQRHFEFGQVATGSLFETSKRRLSNSSNISRRSSRATWMGGSYRRHCPQKNLSRVSNQRTEQRCNIALGPTSLVEL